MKSRPSLHSLLAASLIACTGLLVSSGMAYAQTTKKPVPTVPMAPKPAKASTAPKQPHLPPVNPANFTVSTPSKAEVQSFLKTSWGYDQSRIWEVAAILKTKAPGIHKVVVFVAEKNHPRVGEIQFFVTPGAHYLIAGNSIIPFGAHPYRAARKILQEKANGPWEGGASRNHELVEFGDFECPHCKAAQPIVAKLRKDFPKAHYVFENFPLVQVHHEAFIAADYGDCVAKAGGNSAFFKYDDYVYAHQKGLYTTTAAAKTMLAAAVKAAGLDPAKIAACAKLPASKAAVEASMKLGNELGVDETPTLYVDGRPVPMTEMPYPQLKQLIKYQFSMDKPMTAASK